MRQKKGVTILGNVTILGVLILSEHSIVFKFHTQIKGR